MAFHRPSRPHALDNESGAVLQHSGVFRWRRGVATSDVITGHKCIRSGYQRDQTRWFTYCGCESDAKDSFVEYCRNLRLSFGSCSWYVFSILTFLVFCIHSLFTIVADKLKVPVLNKYTSIDSASLTPLLSFRPGWRFSLPSV